MTTDMEATPVATALDGHGLQSHVLDALGLEVAVVDSEGRIVYVNAAWREFAAANGAPSAVTAGVGLDYLGVCEAAAAAGDLLAAEIARELRSVLDGRGNRIVLEYPCDSPEEPRLFVLDANPLPEGGAVLAHYNVTDRLRAEVGLRAAHDMFQHLVQHSPFGIYAVDADFRLVEVSAGAQKVFETVRPLIGRDLGDVLRQLWPEPFASEAIGHFRHALETGEPYHAPSTIERRADIDSIESYDWKVERVTLPDGRLGVVCHFYDLTDRQRYEEQLQQSEEQLRLAMEAAEAGQWSISLDTGDLRASDRSLAIHGLPPGSPMTREAAIRSVHPDDRARVEAALRATAEDGRPYRDEHRIVLADGSIRWVAAHAHRMARGESHQVVGLIQDITARKHAEELLRTREAEQHDIALALQRALLPAEVRDSPRVEAQARYAASAAALEVGGDWYDTLPLRDGRMVATVGDVVGHGLQAAATMGQLRTGFHALASHYGAPGELLAEFEHFAENIPGAESCTAACVILDPDQRVVRYATAGHPPLLLVQPDGTASFLEGGRTAPLCCGAALERTDAEVPMVPGCTVVLYSDGLVERRGESLAVGLERLRGAVESAALEDLDAACDAILRAMTPADGFTDDVVILAMRLR